MSDTVLFLQGYKSAGVTNKALSALRQGTDYMLKCNLPASFGSNFAYVAQVGMMSMCLSVLHHPCPLSKGAIDVDA